MNRKWIMVGVFALGVGAMACLVVPRGSSSRIVAAPKPDASDSAPRVEAAPVPRRVNGQAELIARCAREGCSVSWSDDGKTALVGGGDVWHPEEKRLVYFDSASRAPIAFAKGEKRFKQGQKHEWAWHSANTFGMGDEPMLYLDGPTGEMRPLEGTNNEKFGFTQTGYNDISYPDIAGAFSSDKRKFSILTDGEIWTWDTATGKRVRRLALPLGKKATEAQANFSPDGRSVVVMTDGRVTVYNASTGRTRYALKRAHGFAASFSADGQILWGIDSIRKNSQRFWFCDAHNGRALWTVEQPATSS